ncbi:porin family protein [Labilibacter marinus]|uniref:hypothetical protein n=1 Tax=Labilibacter marinus TaxID=1477105 RepID=UPI00094F8C4F|nr:hypothetical protein [Labilibacter marinus]
MLKINKLALVAVTLITFNSFFNLSAQERTYSPFSRFGLGETQNIGYSGTSGMANTGIGMRSAYGINNQNVASLTALDSMSFYFDGGFSYFWQRQEIGELTLKNSNIVFDYFALAFSVSPKISSSVGIKPLTSSGYNFVIIEDQEDGTESYSQITGNGNLTAAYLSLAFKATKNLSLGADISYAFGNLRNISKSSFGGSSSGLNHGILKETRIASVLYNFGAQYTREIGEEKSITFGLTYRPNINLKGDTTSYIARGSEFGDDNNLFYTPRGVDTLRYDNNKFDNGELQYASAIGFGVSYEIKDKLIVGFDYKTELWSDAAHFDESFRYVNSSSYSVGAEYIPDDRSADSYISRIRYRGGAYYKTDNINVYGTDYYNYGITFGVGIPLKRSRSSINLSLELGTKEAVYDLNYKQSYGRVTANFSLHELWFYKRQFD